MENSNRFTSYRASAFFGRVSNAYTLQSPRASSDNRGFVTTLAMTLIPLMVLSALSALAVIWFVEQKEKVQWTCESYNLKAQEILAATMNSLIALNPILEATVLEKKFVKLSLAASPTPAEKAILTARLVALNLKLVGLNQQQKTMIFHAHMRSGAELQSLRRTLQTHVHRMQTQWNTLLRLHFFASKTQLRLRKQKIDPLAHIYLEHPLLQSQQEISVQFAITGARLFPKWLKWLTKKPLHWQESCKTQPQKEHNIWNAKLQTDKF